MITLNIIITSENKLKIVWGKYGMLHEVLYRKDGPSISVYDYTYTSIGNHYGHPMPGSHNH